MNNEASVRFMVELLKEKTDQCEELEKLISKGGSKYSSDKKQLLIKTNRELEYKIELAEKELDSLKQEMSSNPYEESLAEWARKIDRYSGGENGLRRRVLSDIMLNKLTTSESAERNGISVYMVRQLIDWVSEGYEEKLRSIGFDSITAGKIGRVIKDVELIKKKVPNVLPIDDTPGSEESKIIKETKWKGKMKFNLWLLGYRTRDIAEYLNSSRSDVRNSIAREMAPLYGKENIDKLHMYERDGSGFFEKIHSDILELGIEGIEKKYQLNRAEATNMYNLSKRVHSIIREDS